MRIITTLCFTILFTFSAMAQTSGLSFLRIGIGARASGMAEAFSALADDATATYWNPANMMQVERYHLSLTHNEWFEDVRSEYVAFVLPNNTYAFGISLNSNNVSGIEIRGNQPNIEPISTFDAHDLALGISYARSLSDQLDVGVTLKYIYEKIYIESTSGFAGDLGVNMQFSSVPLRAAVVVQNIGGMSEFRHEAPSLPQTFRAGVAYFPQFAASGKWLVAADLVSDFNSNVHANIGVEATIQQLIDLRIGYQSGYSSKDLHYGFGLNTGNFQIDYAYVPLRRDLGQSHRLSLGISF